MGLCITGGLLVVPILSNFLSMVNGDHILILPGPSYSLIKPVIPFARELVAKYKHNVTIMIPHKFSKYQDLLNFPGELLHYDKQGHLMRSVEQYYANSTEPVFKNRGRLYFMYFPEVLSKYTEILLSESSMIQHLSKRHYKSAVIHSYFSLPFLILTHKLSIPEIIQYGAGFMPYHQYLLPSDFASLPSFPSNINLKQPTYDVRLKNRALGILFVVIGLVSQSSFFPNEVINKYIDDGNIQSFNENIYCWSLYLLDQDVVLDYPRPMLSNVKTVGGMSLTGQLNPLTTNIQRFMDSAVNGVVVVTFGSNIENIPESWQVKLYHAFKTMSSLHFIVKSNNDSKTGSNILQLPWLPQSDLLAHKYTKAFITHCGNSGQYEALYHGIPMIGLPMAMDGFYNSRRMTTKSFGIELDSQTFTTEDVVDAINSVVYNATFSFNIKKASNIYRSRYFNASQRAAYWVDHVTVFGSEHLKSNFPNLPLYQYYGIDFLILCICLMCITLIITIFLLSKLKKYVCSFKVKVD